MTEDLKDEVRGSQEPEQMSLDNSEPAQPELLPKDVVSQIVARERKKAFEKGKREGLMELEQQNMGNDNQGTQQAAIPTQAPAQAGNFGGMQQLSAADIERMIAEKTPQMLQQHIQQQQHEQTVNSFVSKMQAAEQKYPGLENKLNELDYTTLAPVIQMANQLDNTGDIMNELVENPEKMSNLIMLTYTQPRLAHKKLMDLSNSIKTNQQALAEEKQAKNPLSQLKPSINAGMDNSNLSVSEMRKIFR